ncbi:MAG TPA: ATP-grasp domain-containing protein [Alphaproteobacteria bacterium]|nr:ATP-grasp domain-containing protein [Alphaproteobacteria bacterium]
MIRAAQRRFGLLVIATDKNREAPGMAIADVGLLINTKHINAHTNALLAMREQFDIVGVATCGADVAETVAACAQALGLPGISSIAAAAAQRKDHMRSILKLAGLELYMPQWATLYAKDHNIYKKAREFWFHVRGSTECSGVVVKPLNQSASRGVTLVSSVDDIDHAIDKALPFSGGGNILIEERLIGQEYSVEGIFDASGQAIFFNIVERVFDYGGGIPMELGHINPAVFTDSELGAIFGLWRSAASALGVTWGPFKIDLLIQGGRPYILETAARLSGGWDCQETTPISSGRMPIEALIALSCGLKVDPWYLERRRPTTYAACAALFPTPGRVVSIHPWLWYRHEAFLSSWQPDFAGRVIDADEPQVRLAVKPGDTIRGYEHCADRAGFVITAGETRDEAWDRASRLASKCSEMIITEVTSSGVS